MTTSEKKKRRRKKVMPKKMTRQYRWQLLRKGAGLCPICGQQPAPTAAKSRLCHKHLKACRMRMRRRVPLSLGGIDRAEWIKMDWGAGIKAVALRTQCELKSVKRMYDRLLSAGMIEEPMRRERVMRVL